MVFCNDIQMNNKKVNFVGHNPYFNRWFSAILVKRFLRDMVRGVTILILIDGFLQYAYKGYAYDYLFGHNPYFNRWFSAIRS